MIASSLKDGEALVDLLLKKDADVNTKSMFQMSLTTSSHFLISSCLVAFRFQWTGKALTSSPFSGAKGVS